jgi:3-methyladenine DNA glycosylase AlkC
MAYKKLKYWFDKELAELLADIISSIEPSFNRKLFIENVNTKVNELELKDRVELIADELYIGFGENFKDGLSHLIEILGPENKKETGMFIEFYWVMPIAKYVEKYGLDYFEESMQAIEENTKRNTGEYAIRPFFQKDIDKTIKQMEHWSVSENKHVRRLASEGVRPRLPWAKKLDIFIQNPKPIIPILNNLKDDKSKYVQKSVANCVNDILKDNFEIGKELIESWNKEPLSNERRGIIKHALRNLLKSNDNWAKQMIN